ncbi:hypothetical protein F3Y22_tig00110114pilonHSYRG00401 [Hibiscus syriacus]|uniref:Uncharacterized protein n=1 Tax=Hibiscus syriacus TaxID=106335 RepID=A0A6A3BJA2_HIBSY|nr:hypothetical protein F3Y22_tig00110114pilonHSYRG00401 [Hibiscus syriacus]
MDQENETKGVKSPKTPLTGSGAELSRRVQNLLAESRVQANAIGAGGSLYLPGSTKIHEQSLADMQEVLQQQTKAIARLGNVLKRDIRDMEIIMAEDTDMTDNVNLEGGFFATMFFYVKSFVCGLDKNLNWLLGGSRYDIFIPLVSAG